MPRKCLLKVGDRLPGAPKKRLPRSAACAHVLRLVLKGLLAYVSSWCVTRRVAVRVVSSLSLTTSVMLVLHVYQRSVCEQLHEVGPR